MLQISILKVKSEKSQRSELTYKSFLVTTQNWIYIHFRVNSWCQMPDLLTNNLLEGSGLSLVKSLTGIEGNIKSLTDIEDNIREITQNQINITQWRWIEKNIPTAGWYPVTRGLSSICEQGYDVEKIWNHLIEFLERDLKVQ